MDHNKFKLKNCERNVQNRGKVGSPVAKGLEVQFSLNLFSKNLLEPKPEPELELNFAFGPEGSGSNQGSGPNFSNASEVMHHLKGWNVSSIVPVNQHQPSPPTMSPCA